MLNIPVRNQIVHMSQEAHLNHVAKFMVDGGTKRGDMLENLDVRAQDGGM